MATAFRGEKSNFLIVPEHIEKEVIEIEEDEEEEERQIEIDINYEFGFEERRKTNVQSLLNISSSRTEVYHCLAVNSVANNQNISKEEEVCPLAKFDGKSLNNGKIDGNNNNQECDSEDDEITKEDVVAIYEQLDKANAILKDQITQLETKIAQTRSISLVNRRLQLRNEIEKIRSQRQSYQESNTLLRSWYIGAFMKRFHDKVEKKLVFIHQTLRTDRDYVLQSKSNLDKSQDQRSSFNSEKSTQTIRTMASKCGEKTGKLKNDFINHLKQRNLDLTNKLKEVRSHQSLIPVDGLEVMLVKKTDYLKLLESAKGQTNNRIKSNNCDRTNKITKANTIKPKHGPSTAVNISQKETSNAANGDLKRQFYTCKCGQQFSKNALGYKAAYDSFRQHVARCSVYMKNGAVCDICDAPFHSIPCLKVHIRRIHPERPELLEKYRHIVSCPCGKVFDNYSQECTAIKALRKHARTCTLYRSKAIFCYICKEPFLEPNQLNNHIRMAHSVKGTGGNVKTSSLSKASSTVKKKKVA